MVLDDPQWQHGIAQAPARTLRASRLQAGIGLRPWVLDGFSTGECDEMWPFSQCQAQIGNQQRTEMDRIPFGDVIEHD